jgi:hypothetical protein
MIYMVHGANADEVRNMIEQGKCIDAIYEARGYVLEYPLKNNTMTRMLAIDEPVIEDYTAFDRGDLCADIDRALGDLIERTMHRYMPHDLAQGVRRQLCGDLADIVIDYDKSQGSST